MEITNYKELHELGLKYSTDKSTSHIHKNVSYMQIYDKFLHDKKELPLNFLEFGILKGNSLRAFRDYFTNSNIIGIDINPTTSFSEDRIETIIGSQDDENIKKLILEKYVNLDIILDDASHINELIFKSFKLYWPLLNKGGVYIIEDFLPRDQELSSTRNSWPGQKYNKEDVNFDNKKSEYRNFILDILDNIYIGDVFSIHMYTYMTIIIKE